MVWNNYYTEIDKKHKYKGEFNKDNKSVMEGLGYIEFEDKSLYRGFVKNKTMNGKGRMSYKNGMVYQGEWKDGKAHGFGVLVDPNENSIYEGEWANDYQDGHGTMKWNSVNEGESEYIGDFKQGKKTGKGKYTQGGNVYEGDFVDGQFHGHGKYYFVESGKTYEGDFEQNKMQGKGKMTWPDQSRYEGTFVNGKAHGNGVEYMSNGDKYTGQFEKDLKHGAGVLYMINDQTMRQGEWQNGKRVAWLTQPQSTSVTGKNNEATGHSPSRLYRGGRWRDDFKDNLKTRYGIK